MRITIDIPANTGDIGKFRSCLGSIIESALGAKGTVAIATVEVDADRTGIS